MIFHQNPLDPSGMVQKALRICAERFFDGDISQTISAIRMGKTRVCELFLESISQQIARYLGEMDKNIKAIYRYDVEYEPILPEDHAEESWKGIVNLVAWVEKKSASLGKLIDTLDKAIIESQKNLANGTQEEPLFYIDIQQVDDRDVLSKKGLGIVASSDLLRSTQLWIREAVPQPARRITGREYTIEYLQLRKESDLELAPESRIIHEALEIERLPLIERSAQHHRLTELKVAIIRRVISDQLNYINIAKKWFTASDLQEIFQRRIGSGRIGGKSAGMLLAYRILSELADEELKQSLTIPESYFIGSDMIYIFMAMNGLMHWNRQKYKSEETIRAEYPIILEEFQRGVFPPELIERLVEILETIGNKPLIVRSSSQLEDNFGTSFAGKYDSFFCPNQGSIEENLKALTLAISKTYASTLKPEALLYRRQKGLQDYDEKMAILIQVVQGNTLDGYYFPHAAGVAFSRNIYRWSPQIKREDGFVRLVWGLGTRAVERVGNDYPRLVALSHPTLLPDDSVDAIRYYSQKYIDLLDLRENKLITLPVHQVLDPKDPLLPLIAQLESEGFFISPRMRLWRQDIQNLCITFHEFLERTTFAAMMRQLLRHLEENYHSAVDVEFTVEVLEPRAVCPPIKISLLQCRPQSYLAPENLVSLPEHISKEDLIFSTHFIVPQGYLTDIRYVIYVQPDQYYRLSSLEERSAVGKVISKLNQCLGKKSYICIGPGRWGSVNPDLGIFVSYADIHNAGALVELAGKNIGLAPEPSLGTHFFQDLMEAQIYPLAIQLDDEKSYFNEAFFQHTPNIIQQFLQVSDELAKCVRLIDVQAYRPGYTLDLVMDDEVGKAVAFLRKIEGE